MSFLQLAESLRPEKKNEENRRRVTDDKRLELMIFTNGIPYHIEWINPFNSSAKIAGIDERCYNTIIHDALFFVFARLDLEFTTFTLTSNPAFM